MSITIDFAAVSGHSHVAQDYKRQTWVNENSSAGLLRPFPSLPLHTNCWSVRRSLYTFFLAQSIMKFSAGVSSLVVIVGAASLAAALPIG